MTFMLKTVHFLSGLPRSGSTLLGSLLSQNPSITATPTSPLLDLLCYTNESLGKINASYTFDFEGLSSSVYKSLIESFYGQYDTEVVFDKHRGWPRNVIPARMFVSPKPRILVTVRPISEIITSYIKLIVSNGQDDNFVDNELRRMRVPVSTENRARVLWENYISDPYSSTKHGLEAHRDCIHLVEYDSLVGDPGRVMDGIYDFIGMERYGGHDFDDIKNVCAETKDKAWGLEGLHDIRPRLGKTSSKPSDVIGAFLASFYDKYNLT